MDAKTLRALSQAQAGGDQNQSPDNEQAQQEAQAKREAEERMKRDLLATVLETAARERLSRIALVSPTRSAQIEGMLLRMAQSGQLRGRVSEATLIGLLEQADESLVKSAGTKKGGIVYQRRRDLDDDFDF